MSGRHRTYAAIGRGRLRIPVALGVFTGVLVLVAVAVRIVAASASGCTGQIPLRVAAAPEIAPVLAAVGAEWMASKPEVEGVCVRLAVDSAASAEVASALTAYAGNAIDVAAAAPPTPREDSIPTVWVPDSTAWLTRIQLVDRSAFVSDAQSVASSPVVLAMPAPDATSLGWPGRRLPVESVKTLLGQGRLKLGITEPRRDTAGLAATMLLGEALSATDAELPALVAMFRAVIKASSTGELLLRFGPEMNAGPASEQAVLAHNATRPAVPLVAVRLNPVAPQLDYPYAIRSGLPRQATQAAERFRAMIRSAGGVAKLARAAFREPDGTVAAGFPASSATSTDRYVSEPITETERVARALGLWSAANSPSRTLALFDTTSSMATFMRTSRGGATRAAVMVGAATGGLRLFTSDSRVGMWTFDATHRQVLAIDDLTEERIRDFDARMAQARPSGTDRAELYRTLLAAYQEMKREYDPTRPNIIVVLTDGADRDTSALARAEFKQAVQKLAEPTRPVRVVLIGIDVDAGEESQLGMIAATVGGGYFPLSSPEQIQTIFLRALLRVGAA